MVIGPIDSYGFVVDLGLKKEMIVLNSDRMAKFNWSEDERTRQTFKGWK